MEQGSGTGLPVLERVDLAAAAGSSTAAWALAVVAFLVGLVAGMASSMAGFGRLAQLGAFTVDLMVAQLGACGAGLMVSWWRSTRLAAAIGELERQSAAGVLRVRVRSARSRWSRGVDTELVVADGWVLLGNGGWPAASVALGREPNWWSERWIELQTPSGPVDVSVVPNGDVGVYTATIVDRRARPLIARAIEAQGAAGPSPAR